MWIGSNPVWPVCKCATLLSLMCSLHLLKQDCRKYEQHTYLGNNMPAGRLEQSRWTRHLFFCSVLQMPIDHYDSFIASVSVKLAWYTSQVKGLVVTIHQWLLPCYCESRLPSLCTAIDRLCSSDGMLLRLWEWECTWVKKGYVLHVLKSSNLQKHREVINICTTGQITAYFHSNTMSGGDG